MLVYRVSASRGLCPTTSCNIPMGNHTHMCLCPSVFSTTPDLCR